MCVSDYHSEIPLEDCGHFVVPAVITGFSVTHLFIFLSENVQIKDHS